MDRTTVLLIVAGMISTGTINTLLNKFQDLQCIANCDSKPLYFTQPLLQTLTMFVGEILCLLVYYLTVRKVEYEAVETTTVKPALSGSLQILFLLPTLCDLTATTLMNVGLLHISASIYQMLRGSVVLFTGVFSTLFLGIRHPVYRWVALVIVFVGVGIVGLSSLFKPNLETESKPSSILGIMLVILAQMFTASQFVIEEKIMSRYRVEAVRAVGLEGLFGLVLTVIGLPLFHYTIGVKSPLGPGNAFDMFEAMRELVLPQILYPSIGIAVSIAIFNWCGLAVTQSISATSRSTIDTTRTLFIWISSLALGWETFSGLQVVGFVILIYGTFLFNDVVEVPSFLRPAEGTIRLEEDVDLPIDENVE